MKDFHKDVGVASRERAVKEVPAFSRQSTADCLVRFHALDDVWLVKENTARFGRGFEYGLEQVPEPAANITNRMKAGKIVRCNNWRNGDLRLRLHARIEDLRFLGMLLEIRENVAHRRLAPAHHLL